MIVDQKVNRQFVGVYLIDSGDIDGIQLGTTVKPSWFRRMMTRWFLGWKWVSIKKLKMGQELSKAARIVLEEVKVK